MSDSSIIKVRIGGQLGVGLFAIVDAEYEELVSAHRWHICQGYAITNIPHPSRKSRQQTLAMHRLLMQRPVGVQVDHINGDRLDNRMSNLRLATHAQNTQNARIRSDNTSGFKGVRIRKHNGRWQTSIKCNGAYYYLGTYDTPEEASVVYQAASLIHHGEYARKIV